MKHPIRIAIVGKQRSGKDSLGLLLESLYGFKSVALADKIRILAKELFGMKFKNRQLLIDIGEKLREIDELVWCQYLMKHNRQEKLLLVTDVRMLHEVSYLKEQGFKFIKIHADKEVRMEREGYDPRAEKSRTEREVDKIQADFNIINNGTKEEFYNDALAVMSLLIERSV